MKKFTSFFFSMFFTAILLIAFAIAIAYATFIENDYGTTTAKILIYNATWFEVLLGILCINIMGSVVKYNMFARKKWPMLLFHLSFIVIGIGAMLTRYIGYEGSMHIREGGSSNLMVSTETFVQVQVKDGDEVKHSEKEVKFSAYTANRYSDKVKINGKTVKVKNLAFMPSASEKVVPDANGIPMLSIMAVGKDMQRKDILLKEGSIKNILGRSLGFQAETPSDIQVKQEGSSFVLLANDSLRVSGMQRIDVVKYAPQTAIQLELQKVYSLGELNFVVQQIYPKATSQLVYNQPKNGASYPNAIKTLVSVGDEWKELVVFGNKGQIGTPASTTINGMEVRLIYGSKRIEVPFSIYLKDFQMERYPGSNSPSSFASEVVLHDGTLQQPYRIFMNNILKYKGYRFFQSSYDSDEMGTILSVNHDALGTGVSYFGYFIMGLGMLLGLFNNNSRFKSLLQTSSKIREERKKLFILFLAFSSFAFNADAQSKAKQEQAHLANFEQLAIQNRKGRIEPVNTLASQILRKVAKETSWNGLSATQVLLSMHANPEQWKNEAIIKVSNPELRKQLGIFEGKYASFNALVLPREMGGYKLYKRVQQAYEKSANQRNKLDKEIIYVDERVNILMNVFTGSFLSIFPVPGNDNNKWVAHTRSDLLPEEHAAFAQKAMGSYLAAVSSKDWATANELLGLMKENQQKYGSQVLPSTQKIRMEVFYNKINIFSKLSKLFMFTGLFLLAIQLATVFKPQIKLRRIKQLAFVFILLLFLLETGGLALRWYLSGHAPWSNGYESMIFISWATCLGGLIFANRSEITLSLTTVLAGLTLMVAGMSWMSPEITPLVPVLKSYWLIVHVAIITASYGFLGISALLGLLNLVLMIFRSRENQVRINFTIKELVNIIQIALIIGLLMLTIGSFLGGIWANESWGRYWGWDPKETWALVTILVYTFITHMHRIPGMKSHFAMSSAALVGISSVLMTYFGVNYYLSGLHSYAQGEAAPIPMGVYLAIAVVFVLIALAYVSEKKYKDTTEEAL